MLEAQPSWQWQVCHKQNRLLLDMNEQMQFCTPFKLRQLTEEALKCPQFTSEDAAFYQQVCEYLTSFALWSDAQVCQISLNATAVKHYLKPVLAKSWFFNVYSGSQPNREAIVQLQSTQQLGQFLIVDCDQSASTCICLEPEFALDENLSLQQFEVIKVLNDRVAPLIGAQETQKRA